MTNFHKTTRKEKATTTNSGVMDISGSRNTTYNTYKGNKDKYFFY